MTDEALLLQLKSLIERNHADGKEDTADLKAQVRDLALKVVSQEVYNRGERETERRFGELGRAITDERDERKADVKALGDRMDKTGTSWRTNLWQSIGVAIVLFGIATQLWVALRGGT